MKKFLGNLSNFRVWLLKGLNELKDYDCLCLNLYDDEDEEDYSCELVGTSKFCQDGDDWNFDEEKVYSRKNPFVLCEKSEINDDTKLLLLFKRLLENTITDKKVAKMVKDKSLAYGFVNGRMHFAISNNDHDCYNGCMDR